MGIFSTHYDTFRPTSGFIERYLASRYPADDVQRALWSEEDDIAWTTRLRREEGESW